MHTAIKTEIIAIAHANPTEEICGFIYRDWVNQVKILQCANIAEDKTREFKISMDDSIRVKGLGHEIGVFHSHPKTESGFSPSDIEHAGYIALPFYMYDTQSGSWHEYLPPTYKIPLTGIPYALGFSDCYGIIRDYFRQTYGFHLNDYDRDEHYLHEDNGTILASYEKEGFISVPISAIQTDDILMFKTDRALPQHFAVYRGANMMLHHPQGGLSREENLTGNWLKRLVAVFRHKTLVKSV